jgi:hypothetical protein
MALPLQGASKILGGRAVQRRKDAAERGEEVDIMTGALTRAVSEALWAIYHDRAKAPYLIWPAKRDDMARISEQESKVLITQWLESHEYFYSIETPTREMYIQSGNAPMSARIDVTAYGSRSPVDRTLNMELKAGAASLEAFRKDFEKLLREGVPGLWFHTLTRAKQATWLSLEGNLCEAFDRVIDQAAAASHGIHFAFCVLEEPMLVEFDVDLAGNWREELSQRFRAASRHPVRPDWAGELPARTITAARPTLRSFDAPARKLLVYMPSVEPDSFVHLSTKGESYALRSFSCGRARRWSEPGSKTTSELLENHPVEFELDVTGERQSLESQPAYWVERIASLNREHGIAEGVPGISL